MTNYTDNVPDKCPFRQSEYLPIDCINTYSIINGIPQGYYIGKLDGESHLEKSFLHQLTFKILQTITGNKIPCLCCHFFDKSCKPFIILDYKTLDTAVLPQSDGNIPSSPAIFDEINKPPLHKRIKNYGTLPKGS